MHARAFFLLICPALIAQQPVRQLPVRLVDASTKPEKPVAGARIALLGSLSDTPVTASAIVTDRNGLAVFDLTKSFQSAIDLHIDVSDAGKLALYKPEGGGVDIRNPVARRQILVQLLPKGSAALLDPPQLEALISRLAKTPSPGAPSQPGQGPVRQDLTRSLEEWAAKSGFRTDEVENQIQLWASKILKDSKNSSKERLGLAAFASRQFGRAADLLGEAGDEVGADLAPVEKLRKELEARERPILRHYLQIKLEQAGAFDNDGQYARATKAVTEALAHVDKTHDPDIWLEMSLRHANALDHEGDYGPADGSVAALRAAIDEIGKVLAEVSETKYPQGWAMTQFGLGEASLALGNRLGDAEGAEALNHAVTAYKMPSTLRRSSGPHKRGPALPTNSALLMLLTGVAWAAPPGWRNCTRPSQPLRRCRRSGRANRPRTNGRRPRTIWEPPMKRSENCYPSRRG